MKSAKESVRELMAEPKGEMTLSDLQIFIDFYNYVSNYNEPEPANQDSFAIHRAAEYLKDRWRKSSDPMMKFQETPFGRLEKREKHNPVDGMTTRISFAEKVDFDLPYVVGF